MPASLRALGLAAFAAVLCCRSAAANGDNISREKSKIDISSEILAKSLRRQLMKDNYDYMSSESGEPPARGHREQDSSDEAVRNKTHITDSEEKLHSVNENLSEIKKFKIKKGNKNMGEQLKHQSSAYSNIESNDEDIKRTVQRNRLRKLAKRRKKVQRYMSDINEDVAKRYRSRYKYRMPDEDNSVTDHNLEETTTVKYTVLKLKDPYRRSGHAAALIQEESPQGVSILKLGIGPFPEFRLPRPRRQYMHVPQPLKPVEDDEEELPPPPVDDTNITDDDPHTEINVETTNTIHVPKTYFNEGQNSLKTSVTHGDILVL